MEQEAYSRIQTVRGKQQLPKTAELSQLAVIVIQMVETQREILLVWQLELPMDLHLQPMKAQGRLRLAVLIPMLFWPIPNFSTTAGQTAVATNQGKILGTSTASEASGLGCGWTCRRKWKLGAR